MGLLSNLFSGKKANQATPPAKAASVPNWANLDEEDAFINQYGAELNRMEEKIDNATWTDSDNPADQVKAYEKALDLWDKLESYCYTECGPYGATYFLNNFANIQPRIQKEYDDYMAIDYPLQKAAWDKEQAKKKAFAAMKRKILKYTTGKEGVMRKEIYAQFDPEQQAQVLKALNALIRDGKIEKRKDGERLLFFTTG